MVRTPMSGSRRASGARLAVALVGIVLTASLVAPTGSTASTSPIVSGPTERSGNSGYTWWTEPLMARTPTSFYFTGVTSNGTQRVYRWSRTGPKKKLQLTYTNLRRRPADDHNAPAISMAPGRASLVFYAGHPGTMYVRRTSGGADPVLGRRHRAAFGPERPMPFTQPVTYAQVLRDGPRVVVLTRYLGKGLSGWYYTTSTNSGRTWTSPAQLFDSESHQAYLMVRPFDTSAKQLHVLAYYHPKRGPENVVGYRRMALGDFFNGRASRFTVGAMETVWTSNPSPGPSPAPSPTPSPSPAPSPSPDPSPIEDEGAEPTPDPTAPFEQAVDPLAMDDPSAPMPIPEEIEPSTESVRLLDAGDKGGRTMVFVATWDAEQRIPVYVQMIRQGEGRWSRHVIGSAGGGYGRGNGNYIPGLTLDDRPGQARIFLGYRSGSAWHLATADLGRDGRVGTRRVLATSDKPLARPIAVGKDLMYQRLDRYATYRSYRMRILTMRLR